MDLPGELAQQCVLQDSLLGVGEELFLIRTFAADPVGETGDRAEPLLVGDPDDDHAVVGLPLRPVVEAGCGELRL
ncbi:hypothetical protein ACFQ1L_11705 [Phytohabitans flavus]|uniref:hypothetical protein n=1 Tax=Phytohabitans flavus TaxID=1076124 RepID=UPI00362C9441